MRLRSRRPDTITGAAQDLHEHVPAEAPDEDETDDDGGDVDVPAGEAERDERDPTDSDDDTADHLWAADTAEQRQQVDEGDDRHLDYENPRLGLGHRHPLAARRPGGADPTPATPVGSVICEESATKSRRSELSAKVVKVQESTGSYGNGHSLEWVKASLPMRNVPELMTPAEVADVLRVAVNTLATWRFRGQGPPYIAVEGRVRYPRSALCQYLEQNKRVAG